MSIRLRIDTHDGPAQKKVKREVPSTSPETHKINHLQTLPQSILDHVLGYLSSASSIYFTRVCWAKDGDFGKATEAEIIEARRGIVEDPVFWKSFYKKRFTDKPPSVRDNDVWQRVCQLSIYFFGYGAQTSLKLDRKHLCAAIEQGFEKIVCRFFIEHPYDQELLNHALLSFASLGKTSVDVLRELLKAGADVHKQDPKDRIPLRYNTEAEYQEVLVKRVLHNEPKTEKRPIPSATPLHYAAAYGQREVVEVLLDAGAKIEAKTLSGMTPLHRAAQNGHAEVVRLLLERGANVNAHYSYKKTPLEMAVLIGAVDVVHVLLEARANITKRDADRRTLLHRAAEKGSTQLIRLFLHAGLDIEATDDQGKTPLYYAVTRSHVEAVRVLLEANANISVSYVGRTLWHLVGIGVPKKRCEPTIKQIQALLEVSGLDPDKPIVEENVPEREQRRRPFVF